MIVVHLDRKNRMWIERVLERPPASRRRGWVDAMLPVVAGVLFVAALLIGAWL